MKKLYTILSAVLLTLVTFAQSPEKLSYQAIIRDAGDNLVTNTSIGMQISILQGTDTGTAVYTETQTPTTNINGLATLEIGAGTTSDDFSTIDWSAGPYYIKTETDPTGGSSYTITGTSQLLSVPYALYAKTSGSGNYAGTSNTNLNWSQLESDCGFSVFGCNGNSIATFTTNGPLSYTAGTRVRVTSASDINTFLEGIVQSYSSLVMSVLIDQITLNSGPTNDWVINLGSGGIGVPGMKGDNGQTASECFNYTFDSSTSASPFDGALRVNSTDLSITTQIYINNNDTNFINQLDYYNLISNNSSTIKGTIMVSKDSDTSMWSIFAINNVTDNTGYQTLDVSYLSGTATTFNDFDTIAVCFGRTGDKGDAGTGDGKNILGSTGATDPNVDVSSPNEGDQWINNDTGESFIYQNGEWSLLPINFGTGVNAANVADGSVSNTEFQYLNSVSSTIVGISDIQTLTSKTLIDASTFVADDSDNTKKVQLELSNISTATTRILTVPNVNTTLVGTDAFQVLTNKTIDSDNNTITNISDNNIKTSAGIDATKIADGIVTNTEYQYLNGVTSNVQTQLNSKIGASDTQTLTNKTISSSNNSISLNAANITDFASAADSRISVQKGNVNGIATLDSSGKVPASQLNLSSVSYQGTWNATINSPTLIDGIGSQGNYYVISASGSTNLDGINDWQTGDWVIFNGAVWQKADHTDLVTSVAGKQGAVTLTTADIVSGTFVDARIAESNVIQHEGSINHDNLTGFVTNEHTDHSLVSITAGTGLTGGGTIEATRTIDLDINGLTADASPDVASDYVVTYDASSTAHKKVLVNNLSSTPIYGSNFYQQANDIESSTTSNFLITQTALTTGSLPAGTYRLGYSFEASNSTTNELTVIEIMLDGVIVALPNCKADNDYKLFGGFVYQSLSGIVTATIKFSNDGIGTAQIRRARLELWRVN